jgi:NNP family nitrate/nitrite transporter-like MFS transporter
MSEILQSRKSQLFLLGLLTGIFLINFLSRIVLAPLMPEIEKDLGLGHTGAGGLFMVIAFGYSTGLIGSGFVSSRITHRRTIALTAITCSMAFLLIAFSHTLWTIWLGLFFVGVATGIYLPSGMSTIHRFDPLRPLGKGHRHPTNCPFADPSLGAPLLVEALLILCSWQAIIALIGVRLADPGIPIPRLGPGGNFTGEAPTLRQHPNTVGRPSFWIMAILFWLAIAASMGIYSMMPLSLVAERGLDRPLANTLIGLSRVPVIAMALLSGWITDRIGPKPTIVAVTLINGLSAILLGLLPGRWVILMVFLQPMATACFFAPVSHDPLSIVPPGPETSPCRSRSFWPT